MTQVDPNVADDDQTDDEPEQESNASRRKLAKLEEENRRLKLEGYARDAGLDPNSGIGKHFVKGYDGEMTPEAVSATIKADALVQEPAPSSSDAPPQDGSHIPDAEKQGTQERQQVAAGVTADVDTPTGDPRDEAVKVGRQNLANGGTTESAMGAAFDVIAEAGFGRKDPRAIWEPGKEDPKRPDLGW